MENRNRLTSENDMLYFLNRSGVEYSRIEHPAVFTCEEARHYRPEISGLETKNLFLRDERKKYYLVMTDCAKRLDLKSLAKNAAAPKLQFGTPAQMMDCLGLEPGAVTVLGLVNDLSGRVELLADSQYWPSPAYLCHPLVNTATLVLDHPALMTFLSLTGHQPRIVDIPALP